MLGRCGETASGSASGRMCFPKVSGVAAALRPDVETAFSSFRWNDGSFRRVRAVRASRRGWESMTGVDVLAKKRDGRDGHKETAMGHGNQGNGSRGASHMPRQQQLNAPLNRPRRQPKATPANNPERGPSRHDHFVQGPDGQVSAAGPGTHLPQRLQVYSGVRVLLTWVGPTFPVLWLRI